MANLAEVLPPKSHNNPPTELEYLKGNLEIRHLSLIQEADKHVALAKNIPQEFTEDNEANFATDYIKQVKVCQKDLESTRKLEKEPFLRQGQFIDSFFKDIGDNLEVALSRAHVPLSAYLQRKAKAEQVTREAEAKAMQAEAQKALEELQNQPQVSKETTNKAIEHLVTMQNVAAIADKAAAAPMVTFASSEGKYSKATLTKKWVGTLMNKGDLDLEKLRPYIKDEALQVAINAYVKFGGRDLAGAKIEEIIDTQVK